MTTWPSPAVGLSISVYFKTSKPPCSLNITAFMLLAMDLHWIGKALELGLAAVHLPRERPNRVTEALSIEDGRCKKVYQPSMCRTFRPQEALNKIVTCVTGKGLG
jgi:hypothetical protein